METSTLKAPNSQTTEAIYLLLAHEWVTRADAFKYCNILNFPAIIEHLRNDYNVPIKTVMVNTENKFRRPVTYGKYHCTDKDKLITVYKKLRK